MKTRVCLAGATGWAGSELARAIAHTEDLAIVAAVSRTHAGGCLAEVLHDPRADAPIYGTARDALTVPCDVFVEYTSPGSAKANVREALERGVHVVIGTSGLTDADLTELDAIAKTHARGVLACGNFALTAVLMMRFAEMAAKVIPQWELIDYASDAKRDAPSGTVRELAARLAKVRAPVVPVPRDETVGARGARGATIAGSPVHSLRLPSYVISAEAIFGADDQRLSIRHDSGNSAKPYVEGALLAIRHVHTLVGVHRGLDAVLEL